METPKTKFSYKVGQQVTFKSGNKGIVISISNFGNHDIRPPYNKKGLPVIKGIDFIGYVNIIPDHWENYYNETLEKSIASVE